MVVWYDTVKLNDFRMNLSIVLYIVLTISYLSHTKSTWEFTPALSTLSLEYRHHRHALILCSGS